MKSIRKLVKIMLTLLLLGIIAFASVVAFVCYQEAHPPKASEYDAIVILGAQVKSDGTPSVQLQWRLETALKAYQDSAKVIVTCGAKGADEPMPEADFMRTWLIANGVPQDSVLAENQSFNTRENIANAVSLLSSHAVNRLLIVTSDYHLPRAIAIAKDLGVDATGIGSPCRPEFPNWAKNHFREALSWGKYWIEKYTGLRF